MDEIEKGAEKAASETILPLDKEEVVEGPNENAGTCLFNMIFPEWTSLHTVYSKRTLQYVL